jgi:hypothetical protein
MAPIPLGGTAAPVTLPGTIPNMPAVARILARHDRGKLAAFVTVAIDLLDVLDGNSDFEGECSEDEVSRCTDTGRPVLRDEPGCDIADAGENAWVEWTTMRGSQKRGPNIVAGHEDDEDNGDLGDHSASEDDCPGIGSKALCGNGPGCAISDCDHEHDGREPGDDAEVEQMIDDVPALHVYTLDHNLFSDKRTLLAHPGPGGSVYFEANGKLWKGEPMPKGPMALAPPAKAC